MSDPGPKSIMVESGIEVLASDEPGRFTYIPRVTPEVNAAGQPSVLLLKTPTGGTLQLGAQMTAESAVLEKIRVALESRLKLPRVQLDQAPLSVRSARLILVSSSGDQELQRTTASPLLPGTALFRAPLSQEQTSQVEEALQGTTNRLRVSYDLDIGSQANANVQIEGDPAEPTRSLPDDATEAEALAALERAITEGSIRIKQEQRGVDADELLDQAVVTAKNKAARMLLSFKQPLVTAEALRSESILSEVSLQEPRTIHLSKAADVADWFRAGRKATIFEASGPATTPSEHLVKIGLAFEPKDVPLAFIELRGSGPQPAVLRGPAWNPVELKSAGVVQLKVHYAGGTAPFETEVAARDREHRLILEELGLRRITLDAAARKTAGARKLAATVEYQREGEIIDSWPIQFLYGDWTESWILITAAPTLNGTLAYRWQETGADDTIRQGGPVISEEAVLRIL